jgi:hypothetical protein
MPEAKPNSPSSLKAILTGLVIFGLIAFIVIALNSQDLLWFWPTFKEVPVGIVVHCYGTDVEVKPGQSAFEAVTNAVNTSLSGSKRWDDLSISEATYKEYKTGQNSMVIELHYDPPAVIHSPDAFFKGVRWMIIPLDGRHAAGNSVFGYEGKFFDPGSYHVNSTAPIATALQEQGICTKH